MHDKIIQISVDNTVVDIWRVSEEQWEAIDALQSIGVLKETASIDELHIKLMN